MRRDTGRFVETRSQTAPEPAVYSGGRDKRPHEGQACVRVLINGLHARSGGGVTYLRNMVPRLADDPRLDLHLFIHADQHSLYAPVDERVRLHMLDFAPGFWRLLAWEQLSLPIIARSMAVDVTFSPANFGPLLAPNPVIVLRNAIAVAESERRTAKRLYWAGLGAMTAVSLIGCRRAIAVSEYASKTLSFRLPARIAHKIDVVYHGLDAAFSPAAEPAGNSRSPRFLLAVADIYIQKNLHTLVRALARVRKEEPGIILKIAGRCIDHGYYQGLQQEIASQGLGDHVQFLGRLDVDALIPLYRECAAFVFPSTVETFGNPLAEAMACGTPIACSNTTAMPEIVGDAAVLFDPADAGDMACAILRILREPEVAANLRMRGLKRARSFSWERTAQMTGDILVAAAGGRTRTSALSAAAE